MSWLVIGLAVWAFLAGVALWWWSERRGVGSWEPPHREERWHPSSGKPQPESQRLMAFDHYTVGCFDCDWKEHPVSDEDAHAMIAAHAYWHRWKDEGDVS